MRRVWIRILGIGLFHAGLYLYAVPFLIYPGFGRPGVALTVGLSILVSVAVMGTARPPKE